MKAKAKPTATEAGGLLEAGGGKRRQARFREKKNMGKQGTKGQGRQGVPCTPNPAYSERAPYKRRGLHILCVPC
jgi:hypothetical protein